MMLKHLCTIPVKLCLQFVYVYLLQVAVSIVWFSQMQNKTQLFKVDLILHKHCALYSLIVNKANRMYDKVY